MNRVFIGLLVAAALFAQPLPQQGTCYGPPDKDGSVHDVRCPDGKYHAPNGDIQPDSCNNNYLGKDGKPQPEAAKCKCAKATTPQEECPNNNMQMDMSKCSVYCRKDDCLCVTVCDMNTVAAEAGMGGVMQ